MLKADIFEGLDAGFKKDFMNACGVKIYRNPTTVFEQGEQAEGMVIIAHGYVDVNFVGEDGHQMFLARAKVGATLGESESVSEEPCAASCVTSANTTLLHCCAADLITALQNPGFIKNITKIFHHRLVYDNWVKHIAQFGAVGQRLRGYLYILSDQSKTIRETQSYLANMVGCSRQTINRELAVMREAGLIAQSGSEITVLDRSALGVGLMV
ncbi:MAG: Crp/Fnr family transcriptional regulator [Rhodobacteraceae bacterium]|nr:Crp/Fnr family transcriptional regulator [Paracoccaceae bacterium]